MITTPKDIVTSRMRIRVTLAGAALTLMTAFPISAQTSYDYRVLATSKTSTLEKEMNEAADAGFRFSFVMGGETAVGGSEGVAVLTNSARPRGVSHVPEGALYGAFAASGAVSVVSRSRGHHPGGKRVPAQMKDAPTNGYRKSLQ
jgi:hypothetical protein